MWFQLVTLAWYLLLVNVPTHSQKIPAFPEAVRPLLYQYDTSEMTNLLSIISQYASTMNGIQFVDFWNTSQVDDVSPVCSDHLSGIITGIAERQPWALQFLDAVGKIPSGILTGDLVWLGGYSECRNIAVPTKAANSTMYTGQYCLAYIGNRTITDANKLDAVTLKLGLCMPSTCNETDTISILSKFTSRLSKDIALLQVNCQANQRPPFTDAAIIVIVILSIIGALVVCGTGYDVFLKWHGQRASQSFADDAMATESQDIAGQENSSLIHPGVLPTTVTSVSQPGMPGRVLLCFSMLTNGRMILGVQEKKAESITALHGIRFISMSWVILGHSLLFAFNVMKNPATIVTVYFKRFTFQTIMGATVSVDTFFLLSGTLASYLMLKQINRSDGPKNVNWILVYFHRFWRLTPAYMLILATYTTLFRYMGSGPLYPDQPDSACVKYWWQNLLYINNFFSENGGCMPWMWYIANDMQFFIISPLIVTALYSWFFIGVSLISALILMNIIVVWILTEKYHCMADITGLDAAHTDGLNDWFYKIYVRPYCRIGVYALGLALGYILYRIRTRPRINSLWITVGWLGAAFCCISVVYGLYGVSSGERVLSNGANDLYASTHRIAWAVGVSWVIFACSLGYGGPVNKLLSWSAFVPLSRLTYMAYLIHPISIEWFYLTRESTINICDSSIAFLFAGNLTLAYALAFLLSMILESPLIALEKLLLPQRNRHFASPNLLAPSHM